MTRQVNATTTLKHLKKEARRWLNALRAQNPQARARFERALPQAPLDPGLRDVHHALAREFGLNGWTALRNQLAAVASAVARPTETVDTANADTVAHFLEYACPDWRVGGPHAHARSRAAARRILERHPEVARDSIYTAAVCGDLEAVERRLAERPESASEKGGPKGWEPLLYLCYGRVSSEHAVDIARALLDHGVDPNAFFWAGSPTPSSPGTRYTALCGVAGEGEEDAQPHPRKEALAELLLERGAEPYDIQLFYNTHFHGGLLWFLEPIYRHSVRLGRKADWDDPEWRMIDMGGYDFGARYFLNVAVSQNNLALAEWLLSHGASPNAPRKPKSKLPHRSLHEEALRRGFLDMAGLLIRFGATPSGYIREGVEAFHDACLRLDRTEAEALLAGHPEYLQDPRGILAAAKRDQVDVVAFLLDLGVSPNIEDPQQGRQRPLHAAAMADSVGVAALLIDRGAEIDSVETQWGGTPISLAVYAHKERMIGLLGRHSRQVFSLTVTGNIQRLREVFDVEPSLARFTEEGGYTPLMWLPDDEPRALEIVQLLVAHGADPAAVGPEGKTAADYASKRGQDDVAAWLRAAAREGADAAEPPAAPSMERYERMAEDLVTAYRSGEEAAMQRLREHFQLPPAFTWERLRDGVRGRLNLPEGAEAPLEISLIEARTWIARLHHFDDWQALTEHIEGRPTEKDTILALPVQLFSIHAKEPDETVGTARDWDTAMALLREKRIPGLNAEGQMTDALLERVSYLDHIVSLRLEGSRHVTDAGLGHLARLPRLRYLDISGCNITDRGLGVLRDLPELRVFKMCWQHSVTDAGAANLRFCNQLERVDLMGSPTGDGAAEALIGKPHLRHFKAGRDITDAGLALFQQFPVFRQWQGGDTSYGLMSFEAGPSYLCLGFAESFTDRGIAALAGLDGLAALNLGGPDHVTAAGLEPLGALPHLSWLGCTNDLCNDDAMRRIGSMPRLRMLMGQDAVAGDDGFEALSRSKTIEYIWGRRCHNLQSRGFAALAAIPTLRGLSVSCKNVDDEGLAALPRFPALRELMPMDVPDEGYRHIGRCEQLESLILMYCRETTDAATEHIAGLTKLKRYSASMTKITDRTLEILARMPSLEEINIGGCPGVTDAGVAHLAGLPRLRRVELNDLPHVTAAGTSIFPAAVEVKFSV